MGLSPEFRNMNELSTGLFPLGVAKKQKTGMLKKIRLGVAESSVIID
jgi:hypothetical protein